MYLGGFGGDRVDEEKRFAQALQQARDSVVAAVGDAVRAGVDRRALVRAMEAASSLRDAIEDVEGPSTKG